MAWHPADPARDLLTMQEQLDSLFGRATTGWVPAADLTETADRYVLTLEVPGLTRADVQIEFRDDQLLVRGERPGADCPQRYQQLERGHGAFSRVFSFGPDVDREAIVADLANGLLTITVPKTAGASSRRIDVR
jgi:HSP20 family protein